MQIPDMAIAELQSQRLAAGQDVQATRLGQAGEISRLPRRNIYEAASMALYNMLQGDPDPAIRSLVAPNTVEPQYQKTLSQAIIGKSTGPAAALLSTISNPLVLIGAALSIRWPVASPEKMMFLKDKALSYSKWIPPGLRQLLGLNEIFHGTKIPPILHEIAAVSTRFYEENFGSMSQAVLNWRKAAGRTETIRDHVRWSLLVDRPWENTRLIKSANNQIDKLNAYRKSIGLPGDIQHISGAQFKVNPLPYDNFIIDAHRNAMTSVRGIFERFPDRLGELKSFLRSNSSLDIKTNDDVIKWIRQNYFPHIGTSSPEQLGKLRSKFIESLLENKNVDPIRHLRHKVVEQTGKQTSKSLVSREDALLPFAEDLALIPDSVDPQLVESLRALQGHRAAHNNVPGYSLRYAPAMQEYAHRMARAFAWSVAPYSGDPVTKMPLGRALQLDIDQLAKAERAAGRGMAKTELMRTTYLPMALGHGTFDQAMGAMTWGAVRQAAWKYLDQPWFRQLPQSVQNYVERLFTDDSVIASPRAAGNKIAGWFYTSTLGFNIGQAAQNLFQPLITTAPILGVSAVMKGATHVLGKLPALYRYRAQGMSEVEALGKLFPEFTHRALELGAASKRIFQESAEFVSVPRVFNPEVSQALTKAGEAATGLFRNSELINRLISFESARLFAAPHNLPRTAVLDFAEQITNITQLWTGLASAPSGLVKFWSPLQQYMRFPAKMLGLTVASALNLGGPFTPGTLGRGMLYSALAYEAVKNTTGGDPSRSLFFGALPEPRDFGPFAPMPFLPPFVSLVGGAALDTASGDIEFKNLRQALPSLVPAGVQLSKFAPAFAPRVAQLLGRPYVDRNNRGPDGKLPLMGPNGNVIRYVDDTEMLLDAMGIPGELTGKVGRMDESTKYNYLTQQRDQIRSLRRQFMNAVMDADYVRSEALNKEHMRRYGLPIQVRPQDWKLAATTRMMPRLERLAMTLPADVRQRFNFVTSTGLTSQLDPSKMLPLQYQQADEDIMGLELPGRFSE